MATLDNNRINKRKKEKRRFWLALTIIELLFTIWFASVVDRMLSGTAMGQMNVREWINIGYQQSIYNLLTIHNVKVMFFCLQMVYAAAIFYAAFKANPIVNNVDTYYLTPDIEVPVPAGNGQHGNERFLREEEKEEKYDLFIYDGKNKYPQLEGRAGIVVQMTKQGRKEYILYDSSDDAHSIILGPSGSGKTRRILLQTLWLQMIAGQSVVISDVKGEIFHYTSPYAKKLGYQIIDFNLRNPKKSKHYNFLQPILDSIEEKDMAKAVDQTWDIVSVLVGENKGEPIWHNGECATIAAAILIVALEAPLQYKNLTNVYYFLAYMCQPNEYGEMPLNEYLKELDDNHPAKGVFAMATIAADKTRSSFFTSALGTLKSFTNPNVAEMTSSSDFKLKDISSQKSLVYMIIPDEKDTLYSLVSIFITQLYQAQVELANENGLEVPVPTDYDLDEFGNFPTISIAPQILTAGRSRGVRMHMVLQDYQQLEGKYKDHYKTIKSNAKTKIVLNADDSATTEEISKSLGKYTVEVSSASTSVSDAKNDGMNYSSSASLTGRSLLEPSEIKRLNKPYALVMTNRQFAGINTLPDLTRWHLNKLLGLGTKSHNAQILRERENLIEERDIPPINLWGIWNEYIEKLEEEEKDKVTFL